MSLPAGVMLPIGAALIASALAIAWLWRHGERLPHDAPNERSLHTRPVPRVGGLAIWIGWLVGAAVLRARLPGDGPLWAALALLLAVSLIDDRRGVAPAVRLIVHALASALAAYGLLAGMEGPHAIALGGLVVLALAWSANAFNFMDGSDGLAAAMALTGFAAYALATPALDRAAAYWALVAAIAPFACINFPPARAFMGDCGAVPIGFLAAACGIGEWLAGSWPAWFPMLAFLPFLADATVTLVRRTARRERVWEAHREHFYQRLNRSGGGHRGTLAVYGALMLATGSSAVLTLRIEPQLGWVVLGSWCIVLAVAFTAIDYHWRRHPSSS